METVATMFSFLWWPYLFEEIMMSRVYWESDEANEVVAPSFNPSIHVSKEINSKQLLEYSLAKGMHIKIFVSFTIHDMVMIFVQKCGCKD